MKKEKNFLRRVLEMGKNFSKNSFGNWKKNFRRIVLKKEKTVLRLVLEKETKIIKSSFEKEVTKG